MWRWLGIAGLAGCSANSLSDATSSGGPSDTDTDSGGTTDATGDTGSEPTPPAAYYHLDLQFALSTAGEWLDGQTSLEVEILADDGSTTCAVPVEVLSSTAVPPPADEPAIFGWWVVDLAPADKVDGCPEWAARRWWVGVGLYDVRLDPALAAAGLTGTSLYGLYLSEQPSDAVYVLGYAATPPILAGEAQPVESPPLPGGGYVARSLIAMTAP